MAEAVFTIKIDQESIKKLERIAARIEKSIEKAKKLNETKRSHSKTR